MSHPSHPCCKPDCICSLTQGLPMSPPSCPVTSQAALAKVLSEPQAALLAAACNSLCASNNSSSGSSSSSSSSSNSSSSSKTAACMTVCMCSYRIGNQAHIEICCCQQQYTRLQCMSDQSSCSVLLCWQHCKALHVHQPPCIPIWCYCCQQQCMRLHCINRHATTIPTSVLRDMQLFVS